MAKKLYFVKIASTITEEFGIIDESEEGAQEKAMRKACCNDFCGIPESQIKRVVISCEVQE